MTRDRRIHWMSPVSMAVAVLAVTCLSVVGAMVCKNLPQAHVAEPATSRSVEVVSGLRTLRFPEGLRVDVGRVSPDTRVGFDVPIVNCSEAPFTLSDLVLFTPCCTQAKLLSVATLASGMTGSLNFVMPVSEKPGPTEILVPMMLKDLEQGKEPLFTLQVNYTVESRGLGGWSIPAAEFGEVWPDAAAPRELTLEYALSPYQCEPDVTFSVNDASKLEGVVSIESGEPREESEPSGDVTYIFPVKVTLESNLLARNGESVIVARSPIGSQLLPVRWKVVDEFLTSPDDTVLLFEETPEESIYRCVIRHWEGKPFRVVRAESSDDAVTLLPVADEGTKACVRLRRNASANEAKSGTVSVCVRLETTEEREFEIPWKIVRLQGAAD